MRSIISVMCSIKCNITRSCATSHTKLHPQFEFRRRAKQKLTREIVKHDAKLAQQNLQKLIDVFTICYSSARGPMGNWGAGFEGV